MDNVPPPSEELMLIDRELAQLDARRHQLLGRRAWLLSVLQPPPPHPWGAPQPRSHPETSPPNAQNVLLTLGAVLLTVAALAFTLVSWGHLGIGGRAAVLAAVTLAALAAPVVLLRRSLLSTAESVAGLGLVLTVLDAYALHEVAAADTDPLAYAAGATAALALLWAAYGTAVNRLRLPLPVAVVTAQLPLLLWALATDAGALTTGWALLVTAALDVALALWGPGRAVRVVAWAGACATGAPALLTAARLSATAGSSVDAAAPGALLLAGAVLALFIAWRTLAPVAAAIAGLAALAAVAGALRPALPGAWTVPAVLACSIALLAVVRTELPRPVRHGLAVASGAVHAAAALWALPAAALALVTPAAWVFKPWSGAPGSTEVPWPGLPAATVTLALLAGTLVAAYRFSATERPWRAATASGALALTWATLLLTPAALELPYAAALSTQVALTVAALATAVAFERKGATEAPAVPAPASPQAPAQTAPDPTEPSAPTVPAARPNAPHRPAQPVPGAAPHGPAVRLEPHRALAVTALACALLGAVGVSLFALATQAATFAVFGVLFALCAAACATTPLVRSTTAGPAVLYATALACATGAALELPVHRTALIVLAVPAAVALLGARLRRHPLALPLEIVASSAALLSVVLAATDATTLALVLALCGALAAGTAVRPERRAVGYAAPVLFVLATWVRLAAWDVAVPEAYTLPVTVPALAIGVLRRRRDPEASSWTAYGPGLAATMLPSLVAAWGDTDWLRPLLLGAAALAVTLVGARSRLQALLMIGGGVLALDALHELAPYIVQVVDALPRWVVPALAGLLLLAVGATYEHRLRDARRLRERLARMH
ncbi:SCO7613 C-terminal domain-containing membrane protein [Streptomyces sp. NBC_01465]|uniref:SCO7613 C-terminal domain-containing membrane protein n=1 Tax=Streptomyces sp. NBC_01465 TaxID=2903878 RepID=UPI002E306B63|nr:hypothetical protein [Streptomyces sp. NBC_01465]